MAEGKSSENASWRKGVQIRWEKSQKRFSKDGRRASARISKEVVH